MAQMFEFIGNHWWLVGLWTAFLLAWIWDGRQRSGATVSVAQATVMINKHDAIVVDIRDKEFREGHLVNAINIPYNNLASRLGELTPHKDKPVILVCKTGQTVSLAGKMLREKGFNAVRLHGGMMEWTGQNLPVVKK